MTIPFGGQSHAVFESGYGGIPLRDYFAAKAMQALIRELANTEQADEEMQKLGLVEGEFDRLVAKCAYDYADAMLKERKGEQ